MKTKTAANAKPVEQHLWNEKMFMLCSIYEGVNVSGYGHLGRTG